MNIKSVNTLLSAALLYFSVGFITQAQADNNPAQATSVLNSATSYEMTVYKSASCGCCGDWVDHMKENGFTLKVHDTENLNAIKQQAGLNRSLASCHTAFIDGYVIEGHVPANDVKRLLAERPAIKGLTVPGMPAGANVPGMEVSSDNAEFDVLGFKENGTVQRWNHYQ